MVVCACCFKVRISKCIGFSQSLEEIVSCNRSLALKVGQPKDTGVLVVQKLQDFVGYVVVDDVFKINLVKIVSPGVQHREAFVFDTLRPILFDILLHEIEVSLICAN